MLMPTLAEVNADQLEQINECAARVAMPDLLHDALGARIGAPVGMNSNVVILAQLTQAERENMVDNVDIPDGPPVGQPQGQAFRPPTIFEKMQVRALFNLVNSVHLILTAAPLQPPPAALPGTVAVAPIANMRRVKVSDVLDPMDESTVDSLTPGQLIAFYANYRALKHGNPQEEVEPTMEQISAFHARVVILSLAPYGVFSILTPFGRRMAKVLKHRAWIPNRDGTYRTVEVPGPDSYDVWYA